VYSSQEEEEEDKCDLEPVTNFAETHVINKTEKIILLSQGHSTHIS
jgi:hypothetical protein